MSEQAALDVPCSNISFDFFGEDQKKIKSVTFDRMGKLKLWSKKEKGVRVRVITPRYELLSDEQIQWGEDQSQVFLRLKQKRE